MKFDLPPSIPAKQKSPPQGAQAPPRGGVAPEGQGVAPPSPSVSGSPKSGSRAMLGWLVAAVLFLALCISVVVQLRSPSAQQQLEVPAPAPPAATPTPITMATEENVAPYTSPSSVSSVHSENSPSDSAQIVSASTPVPAEARPSATTESQQDANPLPGEMFPGTRLNLLSDQYVSALTAAQLRYAINEMYARHGADFRDPEIKRWFAQFEWYRPRPGLSYDDTEKLFSYVETENVKRLGHYRDARRAGVPPTKPLTAGTQASLENHATADRSRARPSQPPKLVYAPQPTYPYTARKEGITGSGRFRIRFDARGNATSVDVIRSTGNRPLDMNTIYYLKFWRIAPGTESELVVPISYLSP